MRARRPRSRWRSRTRRSSREPQRSARVDRATEGAPDRGGAEAPRAPRRAGLQRRPRSGRHTRGRSDRPGPTDPGCLASLRLASRLPAAAHHPRRRRQAGHRDRKSTRLNSSHVEISYAVFCLKKKKKKKKKKKHKKKKRKKIKKKKKIDKA